MILGRYIVSSHAKRRYEQRVGIYSKLNTYQCIKQDLHFSRIKRIVTKEDGTIHVFARHSVEFVFKKHHSGKLILKTVIKRNRETHQHTMKKREKQKAFA